MLKEALLGLGASEVVSEEYAASHSMKELMEVRQCVHTAAYMLTL